MPIALFGTLSAVLYVVIEFLTFLKFLLKLLEYM